MRRGKQCYREMRNGRVTGCGGGEGIGSDVWGLAALGACARLAEAKETSQASPDARGSGGGDRQPLQIALQVVNQGRRAGVASRGLFLQALQANRFQLARYPRAQVTWRRGLLRLDAQEQFPNAVPREWPPRGEHLVKDGAERVNVGGRAHLAMGSFRL